MAQFGKDISTFAGFTSNYNKIRTSNQTVAGTPYYCIHTDANSSILLYQSDTRGWTKYGIFSKQDQRLSYEFLKFFHKTLHCSNLPGRNNVKNINEASQVAIIGRAYIYHKEDKYIPFRKIDKSSIRLNSGHY